MSPAKAVAVGHAVVNGPVLLIIVIASVAGNVWFAGPGLVIGLLVGSSLAWLWWSSTVPKWRRWALGTGASPDRLQRLAAVTGLVWPRGWVFERTEFGPRDGRDQ